MSDEPLPPGYERHTALHRKVLAYAHVRIEGAWCAYVFNVPGESHSQEWQLWRKEGCKLGERVALAIFPEFTGMKYAY